MHVAIIMDGNGRWAERRGLKRSVGHRAGARAVRRVVEAAARSHIEVLTLYAFSADNWSRPSDEVQALMRLLQRYLRSELARCVENGVRINVIGRRDRLDAAVVRGIEHAERITAPGRRLTLQLAIDYSARDAIVRAAELANAARTAAGSGTAEARHAFSQCIARATHAQSALPGVDLLIRTGGEQRLSDFLLWECAYAELMFVDTCWPDYDEAAFAAALEEYRRRERRFGGLARPPRALAGDAG